jgi:hypothetical protein
VTLFKIEKGIPVTLAPSQGMIVDSLKAMEVGDSFFREKNRKGVMSVALYLRDRTGAHFVSRAEGSGFRVWRIK